MEEYETQNHQKNSPFENLPHNALFLFQVVNLFPMPIEVFRPDGISAFVNSAFLECFNIRDPAMIVGKLNILQDPYINHELGLTEYLQRAFSGEILTIFDIRVPFREITRRYKPERDRTPSNEIYQDIIIFPIREADSISYIIIVFKTTRIYQEQYDVFKAKMLIEQHWLEESDINQLADTVVLSRHYFTRLFKKHMGMTPYSYYQNIKIERLKGALCDSKLSVAEAFAACGLDYSGSFAKTFRAKTGMTPSQYRQAGLTNTADKQFPNQVNDADADPACLPDHFPLSPLLPAGEKEGLFFQTINLFPIPVQIFNPNGDIIYINEAVLNMWNISDPLQILGQYNLRRDPFVNDRFGLKAYIGRIFRGEIVLIPDIKVPLDDFWTWYKKRNPVHDIEAIYTDILNFPILHEDGKIGYIMSVFFTSRIYQGKTEIVKAKEYMENHWLEDFEPDKISNAVHLSRYHFTHLFKRYTGITPYSYYQNLKVKKLKEALRDKNLTIAEAFAACGLSYHSNYAKLFREKTGMTPSEYRKTVE